MVPAGTQKQSGSEIDEKAVMAAIAEKRKEINQKLKDELQALMDKQLAPIDKQLEAQRKEIAKHEEAIGLAELEVKRLNKLKEKLTGIEAPAERGRKGAGGTRIRRSEDQLKEIAEAAEKYVKANAGDEGVKAGDLKKHIAEKFGGYAWIGSAEAFSKDKGNGAIKGKGERAATRYFPK